MRYLGKRCQKPNAFENLRKLFAWPDAIKYETEQCCKRKNTESNEFIVLKIVTKKS